MDPSDSAKEYFAILRNRLLFTWIPIYLTVLVLNVVVVALVMSSCRRRRQ